MGNLMEYLKKLIESKLINGKVNGDSCTRSKVNSEQLPTARLRGESKGVIWQTKIKA